MIKVLIVDDIPETREHLSRLLGLEREIDVAGTAGSGEEAIQMSMDLRPDVIVMDINMPGLDGIATAEIISQRLPPAVSHDERPREAEQLKRACWPGHGSPCQAVRGDEFATSIKRVHERDLVRREQLQVFAGAEAARRRPPRTRGAPGHRRLIPRAGPGADAGHEPRARAPARDEPRVGLVDETSVRRYRVLLNLNPKNKSVLDAVEGGEPDRDIIETVMVDHSTGIRVLLAPPSPEGADLVTPAYLRKIVDMLRQNHDWVVVDLPSGLNDHTLGVLDAADQILVVAALEITTIKNVRLFLEVADQLDYERSKIRLVINRSDSSQGIRIGDVEASIRRTIDGTIVSDGRLAVLAVNRGVPFVISHPESPLSRDVIKLARTLAGEGSKATQGTDKAAKRGLFARR